MVGFGKSYSFVCEQPQIESCLKKIHNETTKLKEVFLWRVLQLVNFSGKFLFVQDIYQRTKYCHEKLGFYTNVGKNFQIKRSNKHKVDFQGKNDKNIF